MILKLSRIVVLLTGLVFLAFGLACVVAPSEVLLTATGAALTHPVALIDLRATYGGMSIGVAVILFVLAANAASIRTGLIAVLALMLGMAGGRAIGMLIEPSSNSVMWLYLVLEIATASVATILLRKGAQAGKSQQDGAARV